MYEKGIFQDLESSNNLQLLLGVGDNSSDLRFNSINSKLSGIIKKLRKKGFSKMSPSHQAELLEKTLHGDLLKNYKEVTPFYRIFKDGEYNCVSSSALYALILDEFEIPYAIKELPTHVYVLMYPNATSVLIETTAPSNGYEVRTDREVRNSIKTLIAMGEVTEEWVTERGERKAYNEFFYDAGKSITLRELTGIQYYNEALIHIDQEDYKEALTESIKSDLIYPNVNSKVLRYQLLEEYLRGVSYTDIEDFEFLCLYANLENSIEDNVNYQYSVFLRDNLITTNNIAFVDTVHQYMLSHLIEEKMIEVIVNSHNLGKAEYHSRNANFKMAKDFAFKILDTDDSNESARDIAAHSILEIVSGSESYQDYKADAKVNYDKSPLSPTEYMLECLEDYAAEYNVLHESETYKGAYFYLYAQIAANAFEEGDYNKGKKNLDLSEIARRKLANPEKKELNVRLALYIAQAGYYYNNDQYQKALNSINDGLVYWPENKELISRKGMIVKMLE